jgi:hypothetical protein
MQKADVFSFGVVVYWVSHFIPSLFSLTILINPQMMTGEYPWTSRNPNSHYGLVEKWLMDPDLIWDSIKQNRRIHANLFNLLKACWMMDYNQRPPMEDIRALYHNLPKAERLVQKV